MNRRSFIATILGGSAALLALPLISKRRNPIQADGKAHFYVDAQHGHDCFDGLSPNWPKRTIDAAVPSVITRNTIVHMTGTFEADQFHFGRPRTANGSTMVYDGGGEAWGKSSTALFRLKP